MKKFELTIVDVAAEARAAFGDMADDMVLKITGQPMPDRDFRFKALVTRDNGTTYAVSFHAGATAQHIIESIERD